MTRYYEDARAVNGAFCFDLEAIALARAALQALLPVSDETVEVMASKRRDDLEPTADELRDFMAAAITHIRGEGQ